MLPLVLGFGLGPQEILILLAIGLILFGAKRLPELGRSLGQGMREFKRSIRDISEDEPTPSAPASKSEDAEK